MRTLLTLLANAAKARKETIDGEEYLVAPVVMITPDVHTANEGPVYYPPEVLKVSVPAWDKKPLTVYHPEVNGAFVSASDPAVAGKRDVGFLRNVAYGDSLTGEACFNVKKTKEVDPRVHDALEKGETLAVSTGMFGETVTKTGLFNKTPYDKEAAEITPDHLAILPDRKGACDVPKCGCMLNNEAPVLPLIRNEASYDRIGTALSLAMSRISDSYAYIRDVYSTFFIYSVSGKLYQRSYTSNADGTVTVAEGEPVQVKWVQEYRTLAGKFIGNCHEETDVNKNDKVTFIINAKVGFDEADRPLLTGLPDAKIDGMYNAHKAIADAKPAAPAILANAQLTQTPAGPADLQAYLNNAPPAIRAVLSSGIDAHNGKVAGLIANIKANPNNRFSDQWLATQDLPVLEGLAAMATTQTQGVQVVHPQSIPILVNAQQQTPPTAPPVLLPPDLVPAKKA